MPINVIFFSVINLWLCTLTSQALGAEEKPILNELIISDPFIEIHTGPSNAYPITHVIDRGESIFVLKKKTNWYKIKSTKGKKGWVNQQQLTQTLLPGGQNVTFTQLQHEDFAKRNYELGLTSGRFEGAPIFSVYGAYVFNKKLSAEFTLGQSTGNVSSTTLYKANMLMQPFSEWEYTPFFTVGLGQISVNPSATLIDPQDKNNTMGQIGFGVRTHISNRFILRLELNDYIIFSASNDADSNEGIKEWKIGFAIFF